MPQQGNIFSRDTKKVLAILKELTVDTDAETWMKDKRCGQKAILALENHYDGKSEDEIRKQVAKDDLKMYFIGTTHFLFQEVHNQDETNI